MYIRTLHIQGDVCTVCTYATLSYRQMYSVYIPIFVQSVHIFHTLAYIRMYSVYIFYTYRQMCVKCVHTVICTVCMYTHHTHKLCLQLLL